MRMLLRRSGFLVFAMALAGCGGASATVPDPTVEEIVAGEPARVEAPASPGETAATNAPEPTGGAGGSGPAPGTSSSAPGSGGGSTGAGGAPVPPPTPIEPLVGLVLAGATRSVVTTGERAAHASPVGVGETVIRAWPNAPVNEDESIVLRVPTGTGTFACSSGASVVYVREKSFGGTIEAKEEYVADGTKGSCSVTVTRSDVSGVQGTITGQIVRGSVIQKTIAMEMTFLVPRR